MHRFLAGAAWSVVAWMTALPAMAGPVTPERMAAAATDADNWLMAGRDYGDTRYSPLAQIDERSVPRLRLAWSYDLDTHRGQEATPVVVDGVLYTTSAWSKVLAFRAATGELLWQFDPKVPGAIAAHVCCDVVNRGVAVYEGRVYVASLDGRLIALDAASGRPLWSVMTVDARRPYSVTGAPLVAGGKVIIGNGGAEFGVRGYITAYDAKSGRRAWRFYTVPGDPSRGFENPAMRRAAKTWSGHWWRDGGGGTVWNSLSFDPQSGLVYFGTGNASPWSGPLDGGARADALYTASIVAVHVADGAYAWHFQTTPGDVWDYDAAQSLTLATLSVDGRERKVLMQASKNGYFYVLDRLTGEFLSGKPFAPVSWTTGLDPKTGRPDVVPDAHYDVTGQRFLAKPGVLGAHNWQPMAYSPTTGLVYIPAQELPFPLKKDPEFQPESLGRNMGLDMASTLVLPENEQAKAAALAGQKGYLSAWDPVAGREVWRAEHPGAWNGGTLATAGNLVFQGTAAGNLEAYRANDGERLWSFPAQTGIIAAPMTFAVDGRQYVTVMAGWGGIFPLSSGGLSFKSGRLPNRSRVLTFALDGTVSLPPVVETPREFPAPPATIQPAAAVAEGERLFPRYCSGCHGSAAFSSGLVPDLRYSRALSDDALWTAVVRDGALTNAGMVAFSGVLTPARIAAIRAYVISRAQAGYAAEHGGAAQAR